MIVCLEAYLAVEKSIRYKLNILIQCSKIISMNQSYHYPPEVTNLLIDTIPLLCRSKKDVIMFFRGAGIPNAILSDLAHRVQTDRSSINKYEIVRTTVQRVNELGDHGLRARREIIKRVVEFENFSTCWPDDQLKAKGLVAELRRVINVKDSFTRMAQERENERRARQKKRKQEAEQKRKKAQELEQIKKDLYQLFLMDDQPQKRGKLLEGILNRLFKTYGLLVREDFRRVDPDGAGIVEQIDGVISHAENTYLVEMKWLKRPVGTDDMTQHLFRLFNRHDVRGLFIASNGYAESAIAQCRDIIGKKAIALITLQEIVCLLEHKGNFRQFLDRKIQAAIVEKNPFVEILQ